MVRTIRRVVALVAALAIVWLAVAFVSFRSAVKESNERVPEGVRAALSPSDGPALTSSRNILLLGTDTSRTRRAALDDAGRADSMILVRVDPVHRRFAMLSIPRDLLAEVPGYGKEKANAAYALGGAELTVRTVKSLTGLPVHHYAEIDFDGFRTLIDEIGGVTVDVPRTLITPPKDSPESFDGRQWTFGKGEQHLDGRRALAYARARKNIRDEDESDLSRARRQQQVIDAIGDSVVSFNSVLHPRTVPRAVVGPLTTDMGAATMVAMALGKGWASDEGTVRCRLGGDIEYVGGQSVIVGDASGGGNDNRAAIRMFLGRQDPLKPDVVSNPFAPGCL